MSAIRVVAVIVCAWFVSLDVLAQAYRLQEIAGGFAEPLFLTQPAGDSRLFVVQRGGLIRTIGPGGSIGTFADLTSVVASGASGEMGLLGLALDPAFATNGRFYVNYAIPVGSASTPTTFVARYDPIASGGFAGTTLLSIPAPAANHKAGWIGFRPGEPDHLYITTGDGGGGNDPARNGQNLNTNLGKILRVDVTRDDFAADPARNYGIPASNPFVGVSGNDEIWAYGVRNPYRSSFDRQTGDLWIADVGQDAREEVNFEPANSPGGVNYGWSLREGSIATPSSPPGGAKPPGAVDPVYEYPHNGAGASITGGYVYRGPLSALDGTYFFGDYIKGTIGSFRRTATGITDLTDWTATLAGPAGIGRFELASFGEDANGNLFVLDFSDGRVLLLVPEPAEWMMIAAGLMLLAWRVRSRRPALLRSR